MGRRFAARSIQALAAPLLILAATPAMAQPQVNVFLGANMLEIQAQLLRAQGMEAQAAAAAAAASQQ